VLQGNVDTANAMPESLSVREKYEMRIYKKRICLKTGIWLAALVAGLILVFLAPRGWLFRK